MRGGSVKASEVTATSRESGGERGAPSIPLSLRRPGPGRARYPRLRVVFLLALAATGGSGRAMAQDGAGRPAAVAPPLASGTLAGTVRALGGAAVRDATVLVVDVASEPASSDAAGHFLFRALPAGERRLLVSAPGFAPARLSVRVLAGESTHVAIALERSAVELAGVTVSATPAGRDPLAVAQPVTTLGGRELERSLGATLTHTLAWTPGVTARSQGPAASMPVIRGLTGERIVVLHDGQRAGDLAGSAPDHGVTIDPLAAREVEIVRGPAALIHGSTALGGVVNVIADDIARIVPSQRLSSVTMNAQSASEGGGMLVDVAQPIGAEAVLRLKAGARSHGDQRLGRGDARASLDNTSLRNRQAVLALSRVAGGASPGMSGGVALRRYDFEYGLPWRASAAEGVRLRGSRNELSLRAERGAGGPLSRVRVDGTAQWYVHDEMASTGTVATALALRTQQGQVVARTRAAGPLRDGAVGASLLARQNGVEGSQALTPPNDNLSLAVFAFQEVVPWAGAGRGGVRVPVALRLDHVATSSDASTTFGPAITRRFTNLSASAGISVPLSREASVAVNVARATRVPSPEELFSRAGHAGTGAFEIGNPALEAEQTRGVDAVLRVERRAVRAQVALFASRVAGWIGLYPTGRDTTVHVAGGPDKLLPLMMVSQRDARIRGGEVSLEGVVARHFVASLSADVLRASDDREGALPFMPPARVGAAARWDDGRWQLGGGARHVFGQRRVSAGEFPTDAFTVVEAHAGVRLVTGDRVHSIVLRGENLGDRLYRDATSRIKDFAPAAGRNVSLLYRLTF